MGATSLLKVVAAIPVDAKVSALTMMRIGALLVINDISFQSPAQTRYADTLHAHIDWLESLVEATHVLDVQISALAAALATWCLGQTTSATLTAPISRRTSTRRTSRSVTAGGAPFVSS